MATPFDKNISNWYNHSPSSPFRDYQNRSAARGPTYTPIVAEDFEAGTLGNNYSPGFWAFGGATSEFNNTRAFDGSQSMRIRRNASLSTACGGHHYYGGNQTFSQPIPIGNIVWYRIKAYFPSAFSWGYTYSPSDSAAASACSQQSDGNVGTKFMAFDNTDATGRIYLQTPAARREFALPSNNMRINSEVSPGDQVDIADDNGKISSDEWQDLQISVKVSNSSDGYIRYWRNGVFIGEATGPNVSAGNSLSSWKIGDYWNGVPYTDDVNDNTRTDFWIDNVIVATDIAGFGAPDGVDSGGRVIIDTSTLVGDF